MMGVQQRVQQVMMEVQQRAQQVMVEIQQRKWRCSSAPNK
jgi:hypothetical protein